MVTLPASVVMIGIREMQLGSFQRRAQMADLVWLADVHKALSQYRSSHGGEYPQQIEGIVRPAPYAKPFGTASSKQDLTYVYTAGRGIEYSTNGLIVLLCDYPKLDIGQALLDDGRIFYVEESIVDQVQGSRKSSDSVKKE